MEKANNPFGSYIFILDQFLIKCYNLIKENKKSRGG